MYNHFYNFLTWIFIITLSHVVTNANAKPSDMEYCNNVNINELATNYPCYHAETSHSYDNTYSSDGWGRMRCDTGNLLFPGSCNANENSRLECSKDNLVNQVRE